MTPTGWRFGPRGANRPLFGRLRRVRPLRRQPDVPAFHEAFTGCPTEAVFDHSAVAFSVLGRYVVGCTFHRSTRPSSAATKSAQALHAPEGLHRPLFDHFRSSRPPERRLDNLPFPEASINSSTTVFGHLDVGRTALRLVGLRLATLRIRLATVPPSGLR